MTFDINTEFAKARKALVVAPAGCGKTHLITAATKLSVGRQLILTHTHAGVKALRDRMDQLQVPRDRYNITTLDSFSLRFACAYPSVSNWEVTEPEGSQWPRARPAALRVLNLDTMVDVLSASYTGVFVDEYQDCGIAQHNLVNRLAEILPCRIVGDPLQAVFAGLNQTNGDRLKWATVEGDFPQLPSLKTPFRWKGKNEKLGDWLLEIREPLLKNQPFDLKGLPFVEHIPFTSENVRELQLKACLGLAKKKGETVIGIRDFRNRCQDLAGQLNNAYSVFEDAEGRDVLSAARQIEGATGIERLKQFVSVAQTWLTISEHNLDSLVTSISLGRPSAVKNPVVAALYPLFDDIQKKSELAALVPAMKAVGDLPNASFRSKEVWEGLTEGVKEAASTEGLSIRDAIWRRRDLMRKIGRHPPPRCLSTPLLVKGLQCDHGLILNTGEFKQAEWLYVALTRASQTLTVLAPSSVLKGQIT